MLLLGQHPARFGRVHKAKLLGLLFGADVLLNGRVVFSFEVVVVSIVEALEIGDSAGHVSNHVPNFFDFGELELVLFALVDFEFFVFVFESFVLLHQLRVRVVQIVYLVVYAYVWACLVENV